MTRTRVARLSAATRDNTSRAVDVRQVEIEDQHRWGCRRKPVERGPIGDARQFDGLIGEVALVEAGRFLRVLDEENLGENLGAGGWFS